MNALHFTNGRILTHDGIMEQAVLTLGNGTIAAIGAPGSLPQDGSVVDLAGGWLLPGFIDVQVNGGGGVLFNNDLSLDAVRTIAAAHARYGTTALLPTLISETPDQIARALDVIERAVATAVPGVLGLHIEGPFLNPARKGIHDSTKFQGIDAGVLALLSRPRAFPLLVTLAPERTDPATIAALVAAGVRVCAGHSEADHATMMAAFDAGLSGVTHLFNAMPPLHHRAPGLIGAALDDPRPWCGLIVDGVHVDPVVLRIALRARGLRRMMLVTDAMSSVGAQDKDFVLQGKTIHVADGICRFADGTLAGSDLDMAAALRRCTADLGLTMAEASRLASANPAAFLGLDAERGSIAPGLRADFVWLDGAGQPRQTWIGGRAIMRETTDAV